MCVCARDLASVTLSSVRSFFSSLGVAKCAQDQFLIQKYAINSKTVHGCNSAYDRWGINLVKLIETR
jgi:hypothetical protein